MRANFLAVLVVVTLACPGFGQSVTSYVFASGNTGAMLADRDAQANLESFEQANITAVADRIACSLTQSVRIMDAVGVYPDSAENSFVVQTNLDKAQTKYLASLLGRYAHQKFILWFIPQSAGVDRLWIIRSSQPWDAVVKSARSMHVTPLTVTKEESKSMIYVVDFGSKLTTGLNHLTSQLGAVAETTNGSHEMPGDEDRAKAMKEFQRNIKSGEEISKRRLSSYLWSPGWHDATSRTCSLR